MHYKYTYRLRFIAVASKKYLKVKWLNNSEIQEQLLLRIILE